MATLYNIDNKQRNGNVGVSWFVKEDRDSICHVSKGLRQYACSVGKDVAVI